MSCSKRTPSSYCERYVHLIFFNDVVTLIAGGNAEDSTETEHMCIYLFSNLICISGHEEEQEEEDTDSEETDNDEEEDDDNEKEDDDDEVSDLDLETPTTTPPLKRKKGIHTSEWCTTHSNCFIYCRKPRSHSYCGSGRETDCQDLFKSKKSCEKYVNLMSS
jgi:hypothetical protein